MDESRDSQLESSPHRLLSTYVTYYTTQYMSIMRERGKKLVILGTIHANHLEVFFNKMLLKHCMHKNGIVFVLNCSRFSVKEKRIRISSQTISPLSLTLARGRSSEKAAALNPGEEGRESI